MQVISSGLSNALKTQTSLTVHPKVEIEWNHNRYASSLAFQNDSGDDNWNKELFPISSIGENNRPTSGLTKGLINDGRLSNGVAQFYGSSKDDTFKYWISPLESSTSSPYTITGASPRILYGSMVTANKLYVCYDVAWQRPTAVDIYVADSLGAYNLVASNLVPNSKGVIELYWNGSAWTTTKTLTSSTSIKGVKAVAKTMNRPSVRCHVIEIAAKLQKDISSDVASVTVDKVREVIDPSIPTGVAQSDQCTIELENTDNKYSEENTLSEFYGLISKNAKVTLKWTYEGYADEVQTGVFYTQSWNFATDSASIGLDCRDYSVFLQETKMPVVMYRNKRASYIIRDILAKIGFNDIVFNVAGSERLIPYLWYNDKVTVWEALTDIAKAEQSTFFFDRTGSFRYQDFTHVYINRTTPAWTFRDSEDLVRLSTDFNVMANNVSVKYKTYTPNVKDGRPLNSVLWRSDEDVVLRSTPLRGSLLSGDTSVFTGRDVTRLWPEEGMLNIEGEYIKYKGYHPVGSNPKSTNTADWPNALIIEERGILGSAEAEHYVDLNGWVTEQFWQATGGTNMTRTLELGGKRMRNEYKSNLDDRRWGMSIRGQSHSNYKVYGTKVKFLRPTDTDSGTWHCMAGMVVNAKDTDRKQAYYFELISRSYADANRPDIGNVRCYKMDGSYNRTGLPATDEGKKGYPFVIDPQRWYTLEVVQDTPNNTFTFYVDGMAITSFTDSANLSGLWGTYVRGNTDAVFEYAYVYDPRGDASDVHNQRILDRRDGAYASGYAAKERRSAEGTNWFFDEFAPVVHEVREFDVDYQLLPALTYKPLSTNDYEAAVFRSLGTPFKMNFIIDNASRNDATLSGEDFSIVPGSAVTQYLFVYGHALLEGEEKEAIAKDDKSIRKNGLVELQLTSPWIQTSERAEAIAEYIKDKWGTPVDVAEAEVFANPALELGDLIAIDYDGYNIDESTHKYYITGITMDFNNGLGQTLSLRRVR